VLDTSKITVNDHISSNYDRSDVMLSRRPIRSGRYSHPFKDRMEIIQLRGYTEFDKLNIAVEYLVRPAQGGGLEEVPSHSPKKRPSHDVHHYTKERRRPPSARENREHLPKSRARKVVNEGRNQSTVLAKTAELPRRPEVRVGKKEEHGRDRGHQWLAASRRNCGGEAPRV